MNSASRLFASARVGRRASIVSGCAFTLSPLSLLPRVRRNPLLLLRACPRPALRQLPVVLSPGSGPWPQHYGWVGSAADGGSGRTGFRQASTPAARQGGGWPQQIWRLCRICAADRDSAAWVPRPAFHAVSGDARNARRRLRCLPFAVRRASRPTRPDGRPSPAAVLRRFRHGPPTLPSLSGEQPATAIVLFPSGSKAGSGGLVAL